MQWFEDAKFGVFIHWGIYAVDGVSESWSLFNGDTPFADYMEQRDGFDASKCDPGAWAALIKRSSARYAVLTNRHNANQLIHVLADTIGMGGNLLLDIGPRADGSIDERQVPILEKMGRCTGKHAEAIYGSRAGLTLDHFHGPSTLSPARKTLYLFLDGKPSGEALVKGLDNRVLRRSAIACWVSTNGARCPVCCTWTCRPRRRMRT